MNLKNLFYQFFKNIGKCFYGVNIGWHLLAIALSYFLVTSGFDWLYFKTFATGITRQAGITAAIVGGLLPIIVPISLWVYAIIKKNAKKANTAFALGQAAILALLISSAYKFFTGRPGPYVNPMAPAVSKLFRFGLDKGGVFAGWPSSHTTVAFAMSTALIILFPKNKTLKILALVYAFYIGLGVSVSIHWFSDFIAGAIIGSVIGVAVGKSFKQRLN